MKLAVLGAGGRTGRRVVDEAGARGHDVVALLRSPAPLPERVALVEGDALDVEAVANLCRGADAVICAVGPSRGTAPDQDSRMAEVLVTAMRRSQVSRLVIVTGAMQAQERFLGWAYRRMIRMSSIRALRADRHILEDELLRSGLDVTLVRPPRLSDGPRAALGPAVVEQTVIGFLDACARADLAHALVELAERQQAGPSFFVFSTPRPGAFWGLWLVRCALAEFVGIGLAAAAGVGLFQIMGEPETTAARLLVFALFLTIGLIEGGLIGLAQGSMLKRVVPSLRVGTFARNTALPAMLGWALGMAPSTFLAGPSTGIQPAPEPALGAVLLFSAVGGALGGGLIALFQRLELGRRVRGTRAWSFATMLGWALALPLDMLGAMLPADSASAWHRIAMGGGFGLLAGLAFALPTGWAALRLESRRGSQAAAGDAPR